MNFFNPSVKLIRFNYDEYKARDLVGEQRSCNAILKSFC